jgi:CheY-like chemotaxis protein
MRILIIEDDPKMSTVLRDALEKQAHRIVLASSGNEGLDIAFSHQFEAIIPRIERGLADILAESTYMTRLIGDLLTLARRDGEDASIQLS